MVIAGVEVEVTKRLDDDEDGVVVAAAALLLICSSIMVDDAEDGEGDGVLRMREPMAWDWVEQCFSVFRYVPWRTWMASLERFVSCVRVHSLLLLLTGSHCRGGHGGTRRRRGGRPERTRTRGRGGREAFFSFGAGLCSRMVVWARWRTPSPWHNQFRHQKDSTQLTE